MNNIVNVCKTVFAAIGGVLGAFLGGADGFIIALLVFVVLDYISGVVLAITRKELSSEVGFKGIAKKVFIFCLVGVGNIIDTQIFGSGSIVRLAVIFFYLSNEGISLIENIAALGLPIPQKLRDVLAQLDDEKGEDK
jgi:toxin secretion/phage lysis holin